MLLPRLLGLAAIVVIVLLVRRRLSPSGRQILLLTAAAPAILFLVDGFLAVQRVSRRALPSARRFPAGPVAGRRAGSGAGAAPGPGRGRRKRAWERAVAAGAPPAPALFQIGLVLKSAGRTPEARAAFEGALTGPEARARRRKELGLLALAEGNSAEARDRLGRYVATVGPIRLPLGARRGGGQPRPERLRREVGGRRARPRGGPLGEGVTLQARLYAKAGDARRTRSGAALSRDKGKARSGEPALGPRVSGDRHGPGLDRVSRREDEREVARSSGARSRDRDRKLPRSPERFPFARSPSAIRDRRRSRPAR